LYFEIKPASGGYRWYIKGGNHEIMAHSEVLTTKAACFNAIRVAKRDARGAAVYDRT
jgi:uncharacterized protein YegP (UPF0339 family)